MTAADNAAELAAERIDQLLAELRGRTDRHAAEAAEQLTACLVQLYGAGLARIAARLGPERLAELCADPLVESLLLVHDLHPMDATARIRRALERIRPAAEVDVVGVAPDGTARLRLAGGGCPSSHRAVVRQIEAAVLQAAPEVSGVDVAVAPALPPLLQVSMRPVPLSPDRRTAAPRPTGHNCPPPSP
jgi:Fe-S cluster biogenesis protein NfuA